MSLKKRRLFHRMRKILWRYLQTRSSLSSCTRSELPPLQKGSLAGAWRQEHVTGSLVVAKSVWTNYEIPIPRTMRAHVSILGEQRYAMSLIIFQSIRETFDRQGKLGR